MAEEDIGKAIRGLTIFIILALIVFNSFTIIGGGERGVVFSKMGGVQDKVLSEGFHLKKPFIDDIIKFEVRTTKFDTTAASTSKDQQVVTTQVVLNFHLNPESVNNLYQEVGKDYVNRIIKPALEGSVKAGMAKFNAEELIQKRDEVTLLIKEDLKEKLSKRDILVDELNIVDIDFSEKYDAAIEAKVEAEQRARKAENDLKRIEIEKKQTIVQAEAQNEKRILEAQAQAEAIKLEAQAEAEAINIKQKALEGSPEVIKFKWIETWNGKLPNVMTSDTGVMLLLNQS